MQGVIVFPGSASVSMIYKVQIYTYICRKISCRLGRCNSNKGNLVCHTNPVSSLTIINTIWVCHTGLLAWLLLGPPPTIHASNLLLVQSCRWRYNRKRSTFYHSAAVTTQGWRLSLALTYKAWKGWVTCNRACSLCCIISEQLMSGVVTIRVIITTTWWVTTRTRNFVIAKL